MAQDQQITAASYIISFYNNVQALNQFTAQYCNLITEISFKYAGKYDDMADPEKQAIKDLSNTVRTVAINAHIQYSSIQPHAIKDLDKKEKEALQEAYKNLTDDKNFLIKRAELKRYAEYLNKFLVGSVIGELLETSQALLNSIYGTSK